MCIFLLVQILSSLHEILMHLLEVNSFVTSYAKCDFLKRNLIPNHQLNCFPYIAGKVKLSYGMSCVHVKRNISEWSITVCTTSRITKDRSSMLYMMFRRSGNPSSWRQLEAYNGTYVSYKKLLFAWNFFAWKKRVSWHHHTRNSDWLFFFF